MSVGYCGTAELIAEDEKMLIYSYCCYDLNQKNWREFKGNKDGEIYLLREVFPEPKQYSKTKRLPSGRKKLITKYIYEFVDPEELYEHKQLMVKNASGTWKTNDNGVDFVSYKLVVNLINEYQKTGVIPRYMNWFI